MSIFKPYLNQLIALTTCGAVLISCASAPYPCGEPGAGKCSSVTANYDNSYHNYTNKDDLPSQNQWQGSSRVTSSSNSSNIKAKPQKLFQFKEYAQVPANGAPLLSTPKMLRVWVTPYTDNDNIYHDQYYEYMIVDRGTWKFNNNQKLLADTADLTNVSQGQVSDTRKGGYGAFGLADKPTPANPAKNGGSVGLANFPALNMMQQQPTEIETHVGSGIDNTTTIIP